VIELGDPIARVGSFSEQHFGTVYINITSDPAKTADAHCDLCRYNPVVRSEFEISYRFHAVDRHPLALIQATTIVILRISIALISSKFKIVARTSPINWNKRTMPKAKAVGKLCPCMTLI
jgi:hypothetical protein